MQGHPSRPLPPQLVSKDNEYLPASLLQFFREIRKVAATQNTYQASTIKVYYSIMQIQIGTLNHDSPLSGSLIRALIYECGMLFGIWGDKELRDLGRAQFQFENIKPGLVIITF